MVPFYRAERTISVDHQSAVRPAARRKQLGFIEMFKSLLFTVLATAALAAQAPPPMEMLKPALDVGIIVSDIDKAKEFYGTTLGLKLAGTIPMPDGNVIFRYQAGTATLKVRTALKPARYPAGVREAIGFRLLTLYVDDLPGIVKRWTAAGNAEPKMLGNNLDKNGAYTFLADPDGNQVELVTAPAGTDRIAIGLTVSDVERSRSFYREILALQEEKPEKLALLNGESKYTFTSGKTQIKFWKGASDNLPKHTGNITDALGFRYFTFIVADVDAASAKLQERGAKIVIKPVDFGKIARIMMIEDPDGNWIELAALPKKSN